MIKIAYIDDNKELLETIQDYLSIMGIEIDTYDCPAEFSNHNFDELKYDLVISDFKMPLVDGQVFIDFINEKFPQAKTMIYSGVVEQVKIEKSLDVDYFLSKREPIERLEKTINYLLCEKKKEKQNIA